MYIFDPEIFRNPFSNEDDLELILRLRTDNFPLAWDESSVLEQAYAELRIQLLTEKDRVIVVKVIDQLLNYRLGLDSAKIQLTNSPDKVEGFIESMSPSEAQKAMVSMVYLRDDIVMIVATDCGVFTREIRHELCQILGREAVVSVADFNSRLFVRTEGPSDWKHLKAALYRFKAEGRFLGLCIEFDEFDDKGINKRDKKGGDAQLMDFCRKTSQTPSSPPVVCIFDRDKSEMIQLVSDFTNSPGSFKNWGNAVYSFPIPVPTNPVDRSDMEDEVCIEFYYSDDDIMQIDNNGHRLYISTEFDKNTLILKSCLDGNHARGIITCKNRNKLESGNSFQIIDGDVYSSEVEGNIALGKNEFARYILEKVHPFDKFDISAFEAIFDILNAIKVTCYSAKT